jgi:uncharacterized OsmC-like protein
MFGKNSSQPSPAELLAVGAAAATSMPSENSAAMPSSSDRMNQPARCGAGT